MTKMDKEMDAKCRNPECGKEVPEGNAYCSENCLRHHIELKKTERGQLRRSKRQPLPMADICKTSYKTERELIEKSVGSKIELQMSRGPSVRGTLKSFDVQYGKITVEENLGKETRTTIARLSYVTALSIFKPNNKEIQK